MTSRTIIIIISLFADADDDHQYDKHEHDAHFWNLGVGHVDRSHRRGGSRSEEEEVEQTDKEESGRGEGSGSYPLPSISDLKPGWSNSVLFRAV